MSDNRNIRVLYAIKKRRDYLRIAYKVLLRVLRETLETNLNKILDLYQYEFRPGESTRDNVFITLKILIKIS